MTKKGATYSHGFTALAAADATYLKATQQFMAVVKREIPKGTIVAFRAGSRIHSGEATGIYDGSLVEVTHSNRVGYLLVAVGNIVSITKPNSSTYRVDYPELKKEIHEF